MSHILNPVKSGGTLISDYEIENFKGALIAVKTGNTVDIDLMTSAVAPGNYNTITVNSYGLITAGTNVDLVENAGNTPSIAQAVSFPAASGTPGRLFIATNSKSLWRNTGTVWSLIFPQMSGDLTVNNSSIPVEATLATVNSTVGTFGNSDNIPVVTVNGKGLVTNVNTVPNTGSSGTCKTNVVYLSNNTVFSFTPAFDSGIFFVNAKYQAAVGYIFGGTYVANTSMQYLEKWEEGGKYHTYTNIVLTGMTGNNDRINISVYHDGRMFIENRTGVAQYIQYTIIAA